MKRPTDAQIISEAMRLLALRRGPEQRKGKPRVPRACPRCHAMCDTARQARDHCRVSRQHG